MLVTTRELMLATAASGSGIGAFNAITLEHVEAIAAGAETAHRPVIIQISENAVAFHGDRLAPIAAAARAVAERADVPIALHLDHVTQGRLLEQAPDCGFSSVMVDASARPYTENVAVTAEAAEFCGRHGLWLEGELGEVGGKGGGHAPGARTDPGQAKDFVAATGVDALAVAVGSQHAMIDRTARLDLPLIAALRAAQPAPLVLHGSSGVPDEELAAAVMHGIVKVNIGTALNVAFTGAVKAVLAQDATVVDPRRYLALARDAMAVTVAAALLVLAPR